MHERFGCRKETVDLIVARLVFKTIYPVPYYYFAVSVC